MIEIFIYNDIGEKGVEPAISFKSESRKVKGIYSNLERIIDRAEEEIENEIQMLQSKNGLAKRNQGKLFPSFIKLSGEDKSFATLYRANLYGAKNLLKSEKKKRY